MLEDISPLPSDLSHPWNLAPQDAMKLQRQLARRVVRKSSVVPEKILAVAGVDASYRNGLATAAAVVVRLRDRIVLQCCRRYRLPEPIRRAHQLAREKARR